MVIQQLQTALFLLESDPPNVEAAIREIKIAMEKDMEDYKPPMPPVRHMSTEELLKEFGW